MRPLPPRRRAGIRRIATGVVVAGSLAVVRYAWRRLVLPGAADAVPLGTVLAVHLFWLCAAPLILHLAREALVAGAPTRDRMRLGLLVAVTLIGEPVWTLVIVGLAGYEADLRSLIIGRTDVNIMVVVLLVGLELTELRVEAAREQLAQHARLLRSVAEAQLAALTLHLQPHFLFNTLQLVAECARTDAEQAARVVRALRRLLVESARHTARRVVTAAEEIDFIRAYLSIQLTRFEERLQVEIDVDPRAAHAAVPHMLLQPIVENAIQHGIARRAQGGSIAVIVRAIEEGKRLLVLVRDDGPGPGAEPRLRTRQGRGMANTRARLAALYGDDFVFGLRRIGHVGAETRIDIPLREVRSSPDGDGASEEPLVDPALPHRTWLARLAIAWLLVLLVQPAVLMLARREALGPDSEPLRLLFTSQLREIPFYLLAFAAAELVERLRRDDARRWWVAGVHAAAALAVIWLHEALNPLVNTLVGPDLATSGTAAVFGLRVFLVYGATIAFARAHMLTHWAAARSSFVREVNEALKDAERDVCRAQVHQPAVLASLRALEEACDISAEAVDVCAQSLARLLRLCLDALDLPEHDVEGEVRIADAFCAVFGIEGTACGIEDHATLHAVVPPGTLATAVASLGVRPAEAPLVGGGIVASRLELSVAVRTSGMVSELAALQRTLNGAMQGDVHVRRRMSGSFTNIEIGLPHLRSTDIASGAATDVLLSA
jgi:two-component system, LytTR family, sensor kinase